MFAANTIIEGTESRVAIEGQVDGPASSELERKLNEAAEARPGAVVLDMTQVTFVTSAGLRVFLAFAKKMKKADRKIVFCGVQPGVLSVFEMVGFTRIMTFCDSIEAARAACKA